MDEWQLRREVDAFGDIRYYNSAYQLHRLDGPAVERSNGTKYWYQNGKYHRLDGPAIEYSDGSKKWYQNGKCHRLDGPAIEWSDGSKTYCIEGNYYSKKEDWENAVCPSLEMVKEMFKEKGLI